MWGDAENEPSGGRTMHQCGNPACQQVQLSWVLLTLYFSDQKSAHTDRFFIRAIVCDNSRRGPIVGWRHSDFLSFTKVSTHGSIFCRQQLREIIGAILYRSKSRRTRTDFHSDFFFLRQKISPCELGIRRCWHHAFYFHILSKDKSYLCYLLLTNRSWGGTF